MAKVLYRKYRPTTFSEVLGQDHITSILRQAVKSNSTVHSYLFYGPRGTGKTSTARILSKAMNCLDPKDGEPCNVCRNCLSINNLRFLDLIEIDAASNRGIEQIRELKERIKFAPSEGKYKIYIIDEVHMLTTEAFNALLKTLEEPPVHSVFILATTDIHKVPSTIISRCQRYDFHLGNKESLQAKLKHIAKKEKVDIQEDSIDLVINSAKGSFRDAETIFEKVITDSRAIKDKKITLDEVKSILGLISSDLIDEFFLSLSEGDLKSCFSLIEGVEQNGLDLYQFVIQIIEKAREGVNAKVMGSSDGVLTLSELSRLIKLFTQARIDIKSSVIPQLPIELAVVDFVENSKGGVKKARPGNVISRITKSIRPKSHSQEKGIEKDDSRDGEIKDVCDLKIEDISKKWKRFLETIRPLNHSLAAFLIHSEPTKISGSEVSIKVLYKLHKKKIEQRNSQKIIEDVSEKVWGHRLTFRCDVDAKLLAKRMEEKKSEDEDMVGAVKEVFGDMISED